IVDRNGIAKGASGCAMTKLGCAFTSCGASTSSISCGRRGCCAEAVPKVINIKPQPKMAANQCGVVIFFVFIFLFKAGFLSYINCIPVPRGIRPSLREWRAREKILRRHRRNSGLTVSVKVSGSRTGYTNFIIRRIGEPEDYVV